MSQVHHAHAHHKDHMGRHLPAHQHSAIHPKSKIEAIAIPFVNTYGLTGNVVQADFKEKNCILVDLALELGISPMTGYTDSSGSSTLPALNPASFWNSRVDFYIGGQLFTSIFDASQFIRKQLFLEDQERAPINQAEGLYSSSSARRTQTLASTYYYLDLWTAFKTAKIPFIFNYDLTIKFTTSALSSVVASASPSSCVLTFTTSNLLAKIIRIPHEHVQSMRNSIIQAPKHHRFLDTYWQSFGISSGVTSYTQQLTNIIGKVSHLFFVIRTSSAITGTNQFTFQPVASWELLDGGGANMVGGEPLTDARARLLEPKQWVSSSVLTETSNSMYIYMYSWSESPSHSEHQGQHLGSYEFTGLERLRLYWNSSTGSAYQVDLYAMVVSDLEVSAHGVKKVRV